MTYYDAVIVLDADLPSDAIVSLKENVESMLKKVGNIHRVDDIGVLDVQSNPAKKERLYFLSFHFEHDGSRIENLQHELGITKGVNRSFFYTMGRDEPFLCYEDVVKRVEPYLENDDDVIQEDEVSQEGDT